MKKNKIDRLIIVFVLLCICRINITQEPQELKWIETLKRKTFSPWGVKSLPWLIMTDREHIVRAEGFAFNEFNNKLQRSKGD